MNNKTIKHITSHYIKEHYSDFTKIYTDGSKTSEACGIGIWCEENNEKIKCQVNNAMSIMNVELMAINIAIDVIETKEKEKFVICSDSKSALSCIKNENSKDNFIIYNIINKLNKTNKTIKLHTKFFSPNLGKPIAEIGTADCSANSSAKIEFAGTSAITKLTASDISPRFSANTFAEARQNHLPA